MPYNQRMYSAALVLHSLLRWIVLVSAVVALARALSGLRGHTQWTRADERASLWFTLSLDIQTVIGLILYVALSPFTRQAFQDFGGAMRTPSVRFWVMEHAAGMLIAVVLTHVGRVRMRKALDAASRHRQAAIFFGLALLLILLSIPWPGMPNGRPLFRS